MYGGSTADRPISASGGKTASVDGDRATIRSACAAMIPAARCRYGVSAIVSFRHQMTGMPSRLAASAGRGCTQVLTSTQAGRLRRSSLSK